MIIRSITFIVRRGNGRKRIRLRITTLINGHRRLLMTVVKQLLKFDRWYLVKDLFVKKLQSRLREISRNWKPYLSKILANPQKNVRLTKRSFRNQSGNGIHSSKEALRDEILNNNRKNDYNRSKRILFISRGIKSRGNVISTFREGRVALVFFNVANDNEERSIQMDGIKIEKNV